MHGLFATLVPSCTPNSPSASTSQSGFLGGFASLTDFSHLQGGLHVRPCYAVGDVPGGTRSQRRWCAARRQLSRVRGHTRGRRARWMSATVMVVFSEV